VNSQQNSYPNQGPEPEYDAQGNPTPEWEAAYADWLAEVWADDTGEDFGDDAEAEPVAATPTGRDLPEDVFYDQDAPELQSSGAQGVVASGPVHVVPDADWIADYDARHGIGAAAAGGRSWPTWLRLPRRRAESGELAVMASAGTDVEPLTGVLVPRQTGPVEPTSPPELPGPVSTSSQVWELLGQYAELGRERFAVAAERRQVERSEALPLVRDARQAVRAARRVDPEGTQVATRTAERQLATAKKAVPQSMTQVVAEGIAATGAAGTAAWFELLPRMTEAAWLWAAGGATAVGLCTVAWLVDKAGASDGLVPTREERALLMRLRPQHWVSYAEVRGLGGTLVGNAQLTMSGIEVAVRLDGKWTTSKLSEAEENVRALLGARTALRIEIKAGERGGWARMALRTRSAAEGDLPWTPESRGLGLDTISGEVVEVERDARLFVAGASGSGKSWSTRPLMAEWLLAGDHVVLIDGKGEEGVIWEKVIRVASEPAEMDALAAELESEMSRRKKIMRRRGVSTWDLRDGPLIHVLVDEGRVVLSTKLKKLIKRLIDLSSLGRSRGIVLKWCTQFPTVTGNAPGAHAQITANTDARFCLRVKNLTHAMVALDDDADYGPHLIPATKAMRGYGYLGGYGPRLIRTWRMEDPQVKALPQLIGGPRIWRFVADDTDEESDELAGAERAELPAGDGGQEQDAAAPVGKEATDARVLQLVREAGRPVRQVDIAEAAGVSRPSLSRSVARLVAAKALVKAKDGTLTPADDKTA
jgi:hypothetical protein